MYRYLILILALSLPATAQDSAPVETAPESNKTNPAAESDEDNALLNSSRLRSKVRGMRKQVLGGGPAVVKSEKEALKFYRGKIQDVARHADDMRTERDGKNAEYEIALETTLKSDNAAERAEAARKAQRLRTEIAQLDSDIAGMEKRGESLGRGVASIQRRIQKRETLINSFDRTNEVDDFPMLADDVLGDDDEVGAGGDPFADEAFIKDLLRRDPQAARRLLHDADPQKYFERFPLKPDSRSLKKALPFPPADLPSER